MTQILLPESRWPAMPEPHRSQLRSVLARVRRLESLVGLLGAGSFVTNRLDEYSDLDLVVVTSPSAWPGILEERYELAAEMGPLLAAFTGEHVGEPRLLVCLFGPPLVHVDLKFVTPDQLAVRVEDPVVLWARDDAVARGLAAGQAHYPHPDLQWIEDRFWVWVHYAAGKIARGELFEAVDFTAFLRGRVLGPLLLADAGAAPNGVRWIESAAPAAAQELVDTVAAYDARDAVRAMRAAIAHYRALRERDARSLVRRSGAESAALAYLDQVAAVVGSAGAA